MNQKEVDEALEMLLKEGLLKVKMVNGERMFMLTKKAITVTNGLKQEETSDYID